MDKNNVQEQVQQQAAKYVARLYSGDLSAKEENQILAWCAEAPEHQREFDNMIAIWDSSRELYATTDDSQQVRGYKVALGIAATVIIALMVGLLTMLPEPVIMEQHQATHEVAANKASHIPKPVNASVNSYVTEVGEVRDITLPDGSKVTLNTDTEIAFDFSGTVRKVALVRGEAFFAVAKDPSKVFIIDTGERSIRVIGTQFNVRKNAQSLQIAVKEGLVAVHKSKSQHHGFEHKPDDTLLSAGTIGAFSGAGQIVSTDQKEKIDRLQSWRFGLFRFDNEPLEAVVSELNRYQSKHIILLDDDVKRLRISGVYSLDNHTRIFEAMEHVLPIRVSHESQRVVIELKKS